MARPYFHIQAQREVLEIAALDGLSPATRQILHLIMAFVNERGEVSVSRRQLAYLSGRNPDTVKDAMDVLRKRGYITYPDRSRGWEFKVVIRDRPTIEDAWELMAASD